MTADIETANRPHRAVLVDAPGRADAFGLLGVALLSSGRDGAVRILDRAARLEPLADVNWFNLATARALDGDTMAAIRDLRRAIVIAPNGVAAQVALGDALLRFGQLARAAAIFRRALRIAPDTAGAISGLARCQRYQAAAAVPIVTRERGLVVRGAFANPSGYGHCCRRFIQALRAHGVPIQAIGVLGPESWTGEDLDRPVSARAIVNFLTPAVVERVPGLATVTATTFEGPRIPALWRRQSELSDVIIVHSEAARVAWAAQGFPEDRLRVCPEGVDPEEGADGAAPLTLVVPGGRLVSSYRHRILNISDFTPRKNIDGLLRVWLRATTRADDAVLVLKLGKGGSPTLHADLVALVRQSEAVTGRRLAQAAPVVLVDQALSESDMTALIRTATHYWSLSHGEGWDLPLSKAGAMGVSLIAPRHSAYVDYLDDHVARLIPAVIGPARLPCSDQPFPPFHGLDWWHPDEDAATAILSAIVGGDGTGQPSAREHLLQRFSWRQAAERLLAILDEAGVR